MIKCPWCGNTDRKTIEFNGENYLCVARVRPEEGSFDHLDYEGEHADLVGEDDLTDCGAQWSREDAKWMAREEREERRT